MVWGRAGVGRSAKATSRRLDGGGLCFSVGNEDRVIDCDSVVLCSGQVSVNALANELKADGRSAHVIGGASFAGELDAQRAIEEGTLLGSRL